MGAEVLVPLAGLAVVAVGIAYGVGLVRGRIAERRYARESCAALLADERERTARDRAASAALARWERERCNRIVLDKRIGPVAPEAALWWRN